MTWVWVKVYGGLWLLSTVLWAASPALGGWLSTTTWTLVIAGLVGLALLVGFVQLGGRRHLVLAITAGFTVAMGGPLTVAILRAIGSHL